MESVENDVYSATAFILLGIVGIVGNVITLFILNRDDNFLATNNSRLSIGNLAIIDLFFSVNTSLIGIGYIDKKITSNTVYCNIYVRVLALQIPLTYLSHALLAVHRWKTLKSFQSHNQARPGFLSRWHSAAAVWITSIITAAILNTSQVMGRVTYRPHRGTCGSTSTVWHSIMTYIVAICIVTVFTSYIQIYKLVRSQNRQIRVQMESTDAAELVLKKRMVKITKMLFIIFTTLLMCNIPYIAVTSLREKLQIDLVWQRIALFVLTTNYANNFFIYGLMDKSYRAQVKNLIKGT